MLKIWSAVIAAVIIVGIIFGMYSYNKGKDFKLYEEALILEAKGEIKAAHDKVVEALTINPKNKKVLTYKTKLYNNIQNENFLKSAVKNRDEAIRAMNRGDYIYAATKLDAALIDVDQVSPSFNGYDKAQELQQQLMKDAERLVKEAPEKYYLQATSYAQNGEYERAYDALDYILKPEPKAVKLKNEMAFKIGSERYNQCFAPSPSPTPFLIKDALMWLGRVTADSNDYAKTMQMMKELNELLAKIEKK